MTFIDDVRAAQLAASATGDVEQFATVTQRNPLRVRLDSDPSQDAPAIPLTDALVGDRVWCKVQKTDNGSRIIALQRLLTALDRWAAATLASPWSNYRDTQGGAYSRASYRRDGTRGRIEGLVRNNGTPTDVTVPRTIFTLPTGLVPEEAHIFTRKAGTGYARVNVKETGAVEISEYRDTGTASFVSLADISYSLKATT